MHNIPFFPSILLIPLCFLPPQASSDFYQSSTSSFVSGPDLWDERFLQCAAALGDDGDRIFTAAGYDGKFRF